MSFSTLVFSEQFIRADIEYGYIQPTPIQAAAIRGRRPSASHFSAGQEC